MSGEAQTSFTTHVYDATAYRYFAGQTYIVIDDKT